MRIEARLNLYKYEKKEAGESQKELHMKEEKCIKKVMDAFIQEEEKKHLSYREFLWIQGYFIKKKWWVLQAILLLTVWIGLAVLGSTEEVKKSLGIAGTLFVVIMIPELWKNKSNKSTEIEESCFYTLRQIYSARLLLFLLADTIILSCFYMAGMIVWDITGMDLIKNFILPMTVTGGICFGLLCSKHVVHEGIAVALCFLWSGVWSALVMNAAFYKSIEDFVWFIILFLAVLYLGYSIYRTLQTRGDRQEVQHIWS
ncbi:MAG: hypothetical protein QM697_13560 [Lachnospiraceae bacterium]